MLCQIKVQIGLCFLLSFKKGNKQSLKEKEKNA